jgi:hypothetical protein
VTTQFRGCKWVPGSDFDDKFVRSVVVLQVTVGLDQLSEKKRFRLRKCVTAVTAEKVSGKRGQVQRKLKQ